MFIQSSSKRESFIFMKFIKKKGDGSWEKLSTREGKTIKVGLEEVVMILEDLADVEHDHIGATGLCHYVG